jgi:putative toxin-antitoxin system antitoxin component (TIGR02293 family)
MAAKSTSKGVAAARVRGLGVSLLDETDPAKIRAAIVNGQVLGSGLRRLRTGLQLTVDDMARLLDVAARTINRKEKDSGALSVSEADRAFRVARIADLAIAMIGDREKALSWLRTPNAYLGGQSPIALLDTELGAELVSESLYAIAYGGVA